MTKKALWLSRHWPTEIQLEEIEVEVELACDLGAKEIDDHHQLAELVVAIRQRCHEHNVKVIFGVFPTPLLWRMHQTAQTAVDRGDWTSASLPCFAAWNVNRSIEGQKPTFEHKEFLFIGYL